MIDWITAHLVIPHDPIPAGRIMKIEPTGELVWERPQARQVHAGHASRPSHDPSILLSTVTTKNGQALRIDGNPLKFLQGHNLFGSDDFAGLLFGMYQRITNFHPELALPPLQLHPHVYDIDWRRLDITYMFDVGTDADVQQYISSIAPRSRSRSSSALLDNTTLYWQKYSRRWAFKMYPKGPEFRKFTPQHFDEETLMMLGVYALGKLRQELTLRALELDRIPEDIHAINPQEVFARYRGRIVTTANVDVPNEALALLSRATRATYYDWRNGHNVKADLPKNTFYRHRRELLKALNVDISAPTPDVSPGTVVNFVRTLEPRLCTEVPEFAKGSPLYFDPAAQLRQLKLVG